MTPPTSFGGAAALGFRPTNKYLSSPTNNICSFRVSSLRLLEIRDSPTQGRVHGMHYLLRFVTVRFTVMF